MFERQIKKEYLKLSQITYGGEFYLQLKNYVQKRVLFPNSDIKETVDSYLKKRGNETFFSYKNEITGFCANLFENIKTKELVISYRGTERIGLGENENDFIEFMKDVKTDINLLTENFDKQFFDAWTFYKAVKCQNPQQKIVITGQSLGGALAQIVAAKEYTINRKKIETYTYNAPGCRHLLDIYDCNINYDYSFVINYSVMNDWCGMYGEHIGQKYLIKPIPLKEVDMTSKQAVTENILLTTHEGIFDYSMETFGKVVRKPKDFNQKEALSLWYFDKNNPIQNNKNFHEFFNIDIPQLSIEQNNLSNNSIIRKTEKFIKDTIPDEIQNSGIATAIKTAADNIKQAHTEQKEKFIESINNNTIIMALKLLDGIISEISDESCQKAQEILRKKFK